jgi:DNA-binding MarR family transcriptional regulator
MPTDFYQQTPDANVLATEAVMNSLATADALFDRVGRLLRPHNVSAAGGLVLGILYDHGPISPSELGERLIVTRATVTGLVDSLERRGFVHRQPNPADRRGLLVSISPAGRLINQQIRALVHHHERRWMSDLTDDELQQYITLHHRVQESLARTADEAPPTA